VIWGGVELERLEAPRIQVSAAGDKAKSVQTKRQGGFRFEGSKVYRWGSGEGGSGEIVTLGNVS